ncbi:MAG: response regulator [Thermoanaerobaculales bacterium]|jgi:CheY-like chemotaxis protein|nr:response regulator [Thermoanaerobaculales bacterium]
MAKTILIIDDEKDMRVYLEALFRKAGYETHSAGDGDEGVWLAEAHQPDLITLDILMPKKSGLKAYRGLRTSEKTASIPIVVLTGLTRSDDFFGDFGELPRPEAIVEKPIKRDEFLGTVEGLIGAA